MALVYAVCGAGQAAHKGNGAPQGTTAANNGTVDRSIFNGYRHYSASCNHCHGPDGIGSSFGPGLIEALNDAEAFRDAVLNGRSSGLSVMKGFASDPNVVSHIDDIYAYLRARADGLIGRGRPRLDP
jgi:mono/diheme cytochrome c family protein